MSDDGFDWNVNPGPLDLRFDGPDISTRAFEKTATFFTGGTETTFQIPTLAPLHMKITQPEPRQLRIPQRVLEIAKAQAPEGKGYIENHELTYAILEYLCELDEQRKGAPELWAVVAVDENEITVHTRAFTHRSEAQAQIDAAQRVPGLTNRLARFVGEWVDE